MTYLLPHDGPKTALDIRSAIYTSSDPSPDILRLMMLLEASGKGAYTDLARISKNQKISALLNRNGREELAHAYRLKKAIKILTGVDYPIPPLAENPCYSAPMIDEITPATLREMAASELSGEALYLQWAQNSSNADVAKLFMQNALDERRHGARLEEAAEVLESC